MYSIQSKLPSLSQLQKKSGYKDFLIIIDRRLINSPEVKTWLKNFKDIYVVTAGESLKSFSLLDNHLSKILKIKDFHKQTAIVSIGGGTLGDFSGFIASILRRGVGLVHIPSTWLAAIDSAHGGKTALNYKNHKNQIGSFYQADYVFVCKNILLSITNRRLLFCALGEFFKMSILVGGSFYSTIIKINFTKLSTLQISKILLRFLDQAIQEKYKIVKKDPYDKNQRHILNLGHTVGHAIELNKGIKHGLCVGLGIKFMAKWSLYKKLLSPKVTAQITDFVDTHFSFSNYKLTQRQLTQALLKDKKRSNKNIEFIFIKSIAGPKISSVSLASVVKEAKRQGLV